MNKYCIVFVLLVFMITPLTGCSIVRHKNGQWNQNISSLKADIFVFSKLATRVSLSEAKIKTEDISVIKNYLNSIKSILTIPGEPNFDGARDFASAELPDKYKIYGLTILDVLERYLATADINITDNQQQIIDLINAGLDGALTAVEEFESI